MPRPPSGPVVLVPANRSDRAVLENLGQLYRHDLSEAYGHLPNADGTFNNRRLDSFRTGVDPEHRAWLITVAGKLGGFVMTKPADDGATSIADFFVVRALRRTRVGQEAARLAIAQYPGRWRIGFQSYNPGAPRFWSLVATDARRRNLDHLHNLIENTGTATVSAGAVRFRGRRRSLVAACPGVRVPPRHRPLSTLLLT
jgi:predicted acetyltransferase